MQYPGVEHPIFFKPKGKKTTVEEGKTLLEAAVEMGLSIQHKCGGNSTCGTCRVIVEEGMENLSPLNDRETALLDEAKIAKNYRLACQSKVHGPVTAQIPSRLAFLENKDTPDS